MPKGLGGLDVGYASQYGANSVRDLRLLFSRSISAAVNAPALPAGSLLRMKPIT
jgi:hypothetical protein